MSNYYYNNIELPALPELSDIDLIKYPFYIILIKNNQAILSFFTTTGYYRTYNNYFDIYPYGERPYTNLNTLATYKRKVTQTLSSGYKQEILPILVQCVGIATLRISIFLVSIFITKIVKGYSLKVLNQSQ